MSEPEEQRHVQVPPNVYVECPLVGKRLRAAIACLDCEHYVGLNERFPDERMEFAVRFQVACRFPFARSLFEVVPEPEQTE